jgi:hypothetical protein
MHLFIRLDHVGLGVPRPAVVSHPIDDNMDVLAVGVAMGEEDGLMLGKSHPGEDSIGGGVPLFLAQVLARGEAQPGVRTRPATVGPPQLAVGCDQKVPSWEPLLELRYNTKKWSR